MASEMTTRPISQGQPLLSGQTASQGPTVPQDPMVPQLTREVHLDQLRVRVHAASRTQAESWVNEALQNVIQRLEAGVVPRAEAGSRTVRVPLRAGTRGAQVRGLTDAIWNALLGEGNE